MRVVYLARLLALSLPVCFVSACDAQFLTYCRHVLKLSPEKLDGDRHRLERFALRRLEFGNHR
jgi:hypothetical protein